MRSVNCLITLLFIIVIFLTSCIKLPEGVNEPYNPLDPNNPNYVQPSVTITSGPDQNSTITTDVVTFQWQGNRDEMEYRYSFDNLIWTEYSATSSATFTNLDEFSHEFMIQSRYLSLAEGDVLSRAFIVDAIQGPALYVYPKRKEITANEQFQMELWLDDSNNIAGLSTELIFAPTKLRIDNVNFLEATQETVLLKNGGQLITFSEINNTAGNLKIDCAVVEGDPHDISGSGIIVRITFTHLTGTDASLTLSSTSSLENSDGQAVVLNNLVGSQIFVE